MGQSVIVLPLQAEKPAKASVLVRVGTAMTYVRLPLGASAALLIVGDAWLLAAALVALFVIVDVLDGRFARAGGGADTAERRAADAIIDKLSVHVCALAVCFTIPIAVMAWIPILIRDIIQGSVSSLNISRSGVVVAGAPWHRIFSLSVAVWGCAVLLTVNPRFELAAMVIALGCITLFDYVRQSQPYFSRVDREFAQTR